MVLAVQPVASVAATNTSAWDASALARLQAETGGTAQVSLHRTTGAARFVRIAPGTLALSAGAPEALSDEFLATHGALFGISDPASELALVERSTDRFDSQHFSYGQFYRGVPVFGALMRTHINGAGQLTVANGTFVPGIVLNVTPNLSANEAGAIALPVVRKDQGAGDVTARNPKLYAYRDGLLEGRSGGRDHLVWEVEVTNDRNVREFVYVDAHTGQIVIQLTGTHDAMTREVYEPTFAPENLMWSEGDALPTGNEDYDNVISASEDTYELFSNLSGGEYLSWDGNDATMINVIDPNGGGGGCPNAFSIGFLTTYCPDVTSDDVVSHEWTHSYTGATHGLIYAWQSGALNEAYSDMFGEVVDILNGPTEPSTVRTDDGCSIYSVPGPIVMAPGDVGDQVTIPASMIGRFDGEIIRAELPGVEGGIFPDNLQVTSPAGIAGDYGALNADFGGEITDAGTSAEFVLVDDGVDVGTDGCEEPFLNAADVAGKIALIDRGACEFGVKALNAENAGAIGVVIMNNQPEDLSVYTADSYRWLVGENSEAFGGAIRDMWNPTCFANAARVLDADNYTCGPLANDQGGVHSNSGVPNHAFAMLVDGGTSNGQTIGALGMNRTSAIYWHAMTTYQTPTTDFVDHADAIEQSCQDLIGAPLFDIATGAPSPEVISSSDCDQVANAMLATEMREDVVCDYEPILPQSPQALCAADGNYTPVLFEDFESEPTDWTFENEGVFDEYTPRDWEWAATLPAERDGAGFFGVNDVNIGDCIPGSDDQSGVMDLITPVFTVAEPTDNLNASFWHLVATEAGWDGGVIRARINGGEWINTTAGDFSVNAYNDAIFLTLPPPNIGLNTNPLLGLDAFTGADEGSNKGTWGQSQIRLPMTVFPGDEVEISFALGVDGCNGLDGWYVDDVEIYTCGEGVTLEDEYFAADFTGDGQAEFGSRRGNSLSMYRPTGEVGFSMKYGTGDGEDQYLFGDINGDGRSDIIVRRNNLLLTTIDFDGQTDNQRIMGVGNDADEYMLGDWDGDGNDNFATRIGNTLTLYTTAGDVAFQFDFGGGSNEDQYLVGDWNGDGTDDFAVRRGTQLLMNFDFDGSHDLALEFPDAQSTDVFISGDWTGDGTDSIAIRSGRTMKIDVDGDGVIDVEGDFGNGA